MALRFFPVTQTSFEDRATHTNSDFVIDTPFNTQGEILESLTDDDAKQIGLRLGIISDPEGEMPLEVRYTLGPFEETPEDLPAGPNFTSERGYRVWCDETLVLYTEWRECSCYDNFPLARESFASTTPAP